jgi:hypothetical protein
MTQLFEPKDIKLLWSLNTDEGQTHMTLHGTGGFFQDKRSGRKITTVQRVAMYDALQTTYL